MDEQSFAERIARGKYNRRIALVWFDILCYAAVVTFYYALSLRADYSLPVNNTGPFLINVIAQLIGIMVFRVFFSIYRTVWRYANTLAYFDLVLADAIGSIVSIIIIRILQIWIPGIYYGIWQAAVIGSMNALLALVSRFAYELLCKASHSPKNNKPRIPIAIIGAGRLGDTLAEDLQSNPNSIYRPLFFIDTNEAKVGNKVNGLMIYAESNGDRLIKKLKVREVIIAIPRKTSEEIAALYHHYFTLGCKVRIYDTLVSDDPRQRGVLREVSVEDLLFRNPVDMKNERCKPFYKGKTILITGGGGSIGSELCRQLIPMEPKQIVLFDICENGVYDLQQELRASGDLLRIEIGSVCDRSRLERVFQTFHPQIVLHAAAHKHVPLMENNCCEAIRNNIFGTLNLIELSEAYAAERFIMISTDKAVNPTNVMGATKRFCEMIVQSHALNGTSDQTTFSATRFGNVLGSNGSVIPLFKRQIAQGGPVTITDKRMIRYFMTIPEASQLVLQSGAMAKNGELFVLDMGAPVKILELAETMITLSGLRPYKDIEIIETGLRPGEKLYEELLVKDEHVEKTENDLIFIERASCPSGEQISVGLSRLHEALHSGDENAARAALHECVPTWSFPEV